MQNFGRLFLRSFLITLWLLWVSLSLLYLARLGEMQTGVASVWTSLFHALSECYAVCAGWMDWLSAWLFS